MYEPCPDCNCTNLQKTSLACEEVLYRCDNPAQFQLVLNVIGGPSALERASTTNDTRRAKLTAQAAGIATRRICRNTSAHLSFRETFVIQISVASAASKRLLAARRQIRAAVRAFRANT
jgi:hypothetical protein